MRGLCARNPHSADVLIHVASVKASLGDVQGAKALAAEAKLLNPLFPDWYSYMHAITLVLAEDHQEALAVGLPIAEQFFELPGWLAIAASMIGDRKTATDMAAVLYRLTRENWRGAEPWSPPQAVEWLFSVNRWLTGRERSLMEEGLRRADVL